MIQRQNYLRSIEPFMDKPLIQILPGVRRCGKSTIFEMIQEELKKRGISEDHILTKIEF